MPDVNHEKWHKGERRMHDIMGVGNPDNPTSNYITPAAGFLIHHAPLMALGALDKIGRPWVTLWGSERGFVTPISESAIQINVPVDRKFDPVVEIWIGDAADNEAVQYNSNRPVMSALTVDPENRTRVKLSGFTTAGSIAHRDAAAAPRVRLLVAITKSLPLCPKYVNKKAIVPDTPQPELVVDSPQLSDEAIALLGRSDLIFISSSNQGQDMDTNYRGGPPGFVRVVSNEPSGAVIIYPEYSGNRLYQTLGNLLTTPYAGLVVPDFESGNVLHLTGKAEVLFKKEAADILPHSNLAVKITITAARFIRKALSFRGIPGEPSPYTPAVRYTRAESEMAGDISRMGMENPQRAVLTESSLLTPTIRRFRFHVEGAADFKGWKPGQYAALSFVEKLDQGYSHMRDDDPRSLNDDLMRTFTVSSPPSPDAIRDAEFELTIRKVGRATKYLFRQPVDRSFSLPLCGFGGEFSLTNHEGPKVFIAGGIGITPLLGQVSTMSTDALHQLQLLWAVRANDVELVFDTLSRNPQLVDLTRVFLTGKLDDTAGGGPKVLDRLVQLGVHVDTRRLGKNDLCLGPGQPSRGWYICVNPGMKKDILVWLSGERVYYEDFGY